MRTPETREQVARVKLEEENAALRAQLLLLAGAVSASIKGPEDRGLLEVLEMCNKLPEILGDGWKNVLDWLREKVKDGAE